MAEDEARANLEQMTYVNRVQHLLNRASKLKSQQQSQNAASSSASVVEAEALASMDATTTDAPALSVSELMKRKRKERLKQVQARGAQYKPLDPLDWRSKLV